MRNRRNAIVYDSGREISRERGFLYLGGGRRGRGPMGKTPYSTSQK